MSENNHAGNAQPAQTPISDDAAIDAICTYEGWDDEAEITTQLIQRMQDAITRVLRFTPSLPVTHDHCLKLYEERTAEADRLRKRCEALEARAAELEAKDKEHLESLTIVYAQGRHSRDEEVRALQAELKALKAARP